MGKLYWLDDEAWARLPPHLPPGRRGARRVDDRRVLSASFSRCGPGRAGWIVRRSTVRTRRDVTPRIARVRPTKDGQNEAIKVH